MSILEFLLGRPRIKPFTDEERAERDAEYRRQAAESDARLQRYLPNLYAIGWRPTQLPIWENLDRQIGVALDEAYRCGTRGLPRPYPGVEPDDLEAAR